MKHFFLKLRAHWRRIQRGAPVETRSIRHADALDALLEAANPFAKWSLRARWMAGVARWLRGTPDGTRKLLDRLDERRDLRRAVRTTFQKTLREAIGPDLFSNAGLPHEPAVMGELLQRFGNALLPRAPDQRELSALVAMMFPTPASTRWLTDLDAATLERLWKLCADDGIAHGLLQQGDEALHYLASMVIAVGVSPEFQQRLTPRLAIQATPFMALRRELEKYLLVTAHNDHALRSVRMLIAVCQAQTDRIYAHLDEHGVSIGLVYRVERMRAQLARMSKLLDLRAAMVEEGVASRALALLADLADTTQHRTTVSGLLRRSFALLARKMVERHGEHPEQHSVHNPRDYRRMLGAGARAGVPLALASLVALLLPAEGSRFLDGVAAAAGFTAIFTIAVAVRGNLPGRLSPLAVPLLATHAESLETVEGLRRFAGHVAPLVRGQTAAVLGALAVVTGVTALAGAAAHFMPGPMPASVVPAKVFRDLSVAGPTLPWAVATGFLLWLSSIIAGFADNWFAVRKLRSAIAQQPRLLRWLGARQAQRAADWLERNTALLAATIALGTLFGMVPIVAQFFGIPFEIRYALLDAGKLAATAAIEGATWRDAGFWLAVAGVAGSAVANIGASLAFTLVLALRVRGLSARMRSLVYLALARGLAGRPRYFLLPERDGAASPPLPIPEAAVTRTGEERRSRAGGR